MKTKTHKQTLVLTPHDNRRLADLQGQLNEHLRQIETRFEVTIHSRGNQFEISGEAGNVAKATIALENIYEHTQTKDSLNPHKIHMLLNEADTEHTSKEQFPEDYRNLSVGSRYMRIKPRSINQYHYIKNILNHDIVFGIGPAGTGKTYLAVACAVSALQQEKVRRIVLVRPAVEAGERLGFLPGDVAHKIDPYLKPLYDALYDMLGAEQVARLLESNVIEIAPLAYMRGRTLNDSFIILDEAQNTTVEQMKMFLTRMGFGSKSVITGDITQIDLPKGMLSGLKHATEVLKPIAAIPFMFFSTQDVVRHPLVQQVVQAYSNYHADRDD